MVLTGQQPQQRIYVGGMDPRRGLTVTEVWERLQARLAEEGRSWSDLHQGSGCLQFSTFDESTLARIQSWFHNVTWKGCKLVVAAARPHFLQRLQEERALRSAAMSTVPVASPSPTERSEPSLPRHWRLQRRALGVRLVDTQPCDVMSWEELTRVRQRHRAYREKQPTEGTQRPRESHRAVSTKEAQKQAYYHRAIRMRFTEEEEEEHVARAAMMDPTSSEAQSDPDASSSSVQDMEESDSSADDEVDPSMPRGRYVWSDSETESDDAPGRDDGPSDVVRALHDSLESTAPPPTTVPTPHTYEWSEDEDDTSSEEEGSPATRVPSNGVDEFAYTVPSRSEGPSSATEGAMDYVDLTSDVQRNLQILAQLFPDRSPTARPVPLEATATAPTTSARTGWNAAGQMLRFDPALPNSARLLVLDPAVESTVDEQDAPQNLPSIPETETETVVTHPSETKDGTVANVYEQEKLEQVFKEVREATSVVADGGASFSFGFDLGATDTPMEEASSVYIAEDLAIEHAAETAAPSGSTSTSVPMDAEYDPVVPHDDTADPPDRRPRYRAFDFPTKEMLHECVRHFYLDINDGARMIHDREGWRNDPTVRDQWMKERFALTQDWKRKRKYALVKKQKRQSNR